MKKIISLLILLTPLAALAAEPSVLINEIAWMGTENSANDEWLELYNPAANEIDLTGWLLETDDGSPKIELAGKIPAGSYFLLERTDDDTLPETTADQIYTGSLSNAGEWLKLYDSQSKIIDEINAAAGWPAGNNETKQTLERADQDNWQTSELAFGTPKAPNSQSATTTPELPSETNNDPLTAPTGGGGGSKTQMPIEPNIPKGSVIFNEILPNPKGLDENEFIELKNVSQTRIDLADWRITNINKQTFVLPSLSLAPNSIIVFYRRETNLVLNNAKEKLALYSKNGKIIDEVNYKSEAPESQSYQKNNANNWQWETSSPGQENSAKEEILPQAVINGPKAAAVGEIITFDASDSFDPQNRKLDFLWDFGDGRTDKGIFARQIYLKPGNYEVSLKAKTESNASTTEKLKIKITGGKEAKEATHELNATTTPTTTPPLTTLTEIPFIFISEFLPNPKGLDEAEFIELFSNHDKPVNLAGWKLDDAEGGSKPYLIPEGTIIKPGQYLAFLRTETKIALNNSDEAVRLIAPDGTLVDYTDYEESKEGISFVLDEQFSWQQSQTPTPGEINVLDSENQEPEAIDEEKNTSTPKILGTNTEEDLNNKQIEIEKAKPNGKIKYLIMTITILAIFGLVFLKKIKEK